MTQIITLNVTAEAVYFSLCVVSFTIILALRIRAVRQLTILGLWHEKRLPLYWCQHRGIFKTYWLRYRLWVAKQKQKNKVKI